MKGFRKFKDCFKESDTVRPAHLLCEDFKKERTDWEGIAGFKMMVYILLSDPEKGFPHLRGKAESGDFGYKLEFVKQ